MCRHRYEPQDGPGALPGFANTRATRGAHSLTLTRMKRAKHTAIELETPARLCRSMWALADTHLEVGTRVLCARVPPSTHTEMEKTIT